MNTINMRTNRKDYINSNKIKTMAWLFSSKPCGLDQTGVIAEPVLDHLASNWNVWWNRSWLVASISLHCERNKTKLAFLHPPTPPHPPRPNSMLKKKQTQSSRGFSLAQHKDRQNNWTYVDLQIKNTGKRVLTWIFTADVVRGRTEAGGPPSCHACKTPASYGLTVTPANKPPPAPPGVAILGRRPRVTLALSDWYRASPPPHRNSKKICGAASKRRLEWRQNSAEVLLPFNQHGYFICKALKKHMHLQHFIQEYDTK